MKTEIRRSGDLDKFLLYEVVGHCTDNGCADVGVGVIHHPDCGSEFLGAFDTEALARQHQLFYEMVDERNRQDAKWGPADHPNGTGGLTLNLDASIAKAQCQTVFDAGHGTWRHILAEEVAEAHAEDDITKLRAELIQVGAVVFAWLEAIDRKASPVYPSSSPSSPPRGCAEGDSFPF